MSYDYDYDAIYGAVAGVLGVYYLILLAICIVMIVAMWKIFAKAGKPGWAAIVPLYNGYCLYDIAFGSGWLFLLTFVPVVGAIMAIVMLFKLAQAFGKGVGFGFGLWLLMPIFILILAFDDSVYIG